MNQIRLSVATTMFKSESYLEEFCSRVVEVADQLTSDSYEIVLVNDGSPDNSLSKALRLQEQNPHIRVVDLSRNFGHHKAMMTALAHTRGELVFLIDCDLEEPPESLDVLARTLADDTVADAAFGVQQAARNAPWFHRWSGWAYFRIFNMLSQHRIVEDQLTARLMTRRYVDALLLHREHRFNIEGLWHITGFKQIPVQIEKSGYKGESSYTTKDKIKYFVNAVTAFSEKPLVYIAFLGLFITLTSLVAIFYFSIQYFAFDAVVEGWTSLMVSVWFFSGLIILMLGIVSIYISVMFAEIKQRPYSIVREIYEPLSLYKGEVADGE